MGKTTCSRGAQRVLCAPQGTESPSTVPGQFKVAQEDPLIVKIRIPGACAPRTCKVARAHAKTEKPHLGLRRSQRPNFGLKITATVEFILALTTTPSSKPIRPVANRQKPKLHQTQHEKMQNIIDSSPKLQSKAYRKHPLYPSSIA